MNYFVRSLIIAISFFFAINVCGQNKLDDLVIANAKLSKEIADLERELDAIYKNIQNAQIEKVKDFILCNNLKHDIDSLAKLNTKEFLIQLEHEIDSLESCNNELQKNIDDLAGKLASDRESLGKTQVAMENMGAFKEVQKQQQFQDCMLYTQTPYSRIQLPELLSLLGQSKEYSEMKLYEEYVKRLRFAIANKNIYDEGIRAINTPFNNDTIVAIREKIIPILELTKDDFKTGVFKLPKEQFVELDTLDIKLSRFKGGIKVLISTINEINSNAEIVKLRATNDPSNKSQIISLMRLYVFPEDGTERAKVHNRYFKMVPYLGKMLKQYWEEVKKNPFANSTETERIIANNVMEK